MTKPAIRPAEGLVVYRCLMIVGSFAPLFILLAIRGVPMIADPKLGAVPVMPASLFLWGCVALAIVPTLIIFFRVRKAIKANDTRTIIAGEVTDNREHLLIYLFALILPLYQNSYSGIRDVWAAAVLVLFVFFILYHLSLHYMNLLFALLGYRVYTVRMGDSSNSFSGQCPFVVLSKRHDIPKQTKLLVHRISDTVYIEYEGRTNHGDQS
jgi:hypothetical protein